MSQRLIQAFKSVGIASHKRSNSFWYPLCPKPGLACEPRLSSSLAGCTLSGRDSKIDQREAHLRDPPQNRVELQLDSWQASDNDGSKIKQEKGGLDTESTGNNGIHLEDTSIISKEDSIYNQGISTQQQSSTEHEHATAQVPKYLSNSSLKPSSRGIITTSEDPVTPGSLNSTNSDEGLQNVKILKGAVPLICQKTQELHKAHFLDALRAKDAIDLVKRPAINKHQKALIHDKVRSKDTWSFDWSVPLFKLRDALLQQKTKTPKESARFIAAAEFEKINLVNNDHVAIPVSSIPKPRLWTKASFAQHVHDLSRSRMPSQARTSAEGQEGISHQTMVRKQLEGVMFVPENAGLISFAALESAMRFYYKFGLLPSVQSLYFYIRKIEYPFPDRIIDLILRHTAKDKDLHNFTSMLHGALTQGFVPSEMTWVSLLLCLLSNKSRKAVLNMMYKHELLKDKETRQDVALVEFEMALSSSSNLSHIEKFIDRMDKQYGQDWFTVRSANNLLKELCKSPSGQPITDFLDLMSKRGCPPGIDSMNILLQRCFRVTDLEAALTVFARFFEHRRVIPDQRSYELLFKTAWNARHANTCKVLWAAACMHKRVTHSIRKLVKASLLRTKPASTSHAWHRWRWQAGKLIAGIDPELKSPSRSIQLQSNTLSTMPPVARMKEAIASNAEDGKTLAKRIRYAQAMLQHDETLFSRFHYSLDLISTQLALAYKMDQEWKTNGINKWELKDQMELIIKTSMSPRSRKALKHLQEDTK